MSIGQKQIVLGKGTAPSRYLITALAPRLVISSSSIKLELHDGDSVQGRPLIHGMQRKCHSDAYFITNYLQVVVMIPQSGVRSSLHKIELIDDVALDRFIPNVSVKQHR